MTASRLAVGALPGIEEREDNDRWKKPQVITLPVLVNGTIRNEDCDHFQFHCLSLHGNLFGQPFGPDLDPHVPASPPSNPNLERVGHAGIYGFDWLPKLNNKIGRHSLDRQTVYQL